MGFTDLVGLHYWFKRVGFNRQLLGSPEAVRENGEPAGAMRLAGRSAVKFSLNDALGGSLRQPQASTNLANLAIREPLSAGLR